MADHLRFLEPSTGDLASSEEFLTGKEVVYRTGHSNNCDGACGHLVHVTDGRVTMVGPASWGTTTVAGEQAPTFHPRICLRGLSQISNTYSPDRIKYPYKRVGERGSGKWQRITWDEATTLIADELQAHPGEVRQDRGLGRALHRLAGADRRRHRGGVPLRERHRRLGGRLRR